MPRKTTGHLFSRVHQVLCIISKPSVQSNWSYSPENPIQVKIDECIVSWWSINIPVDVDVITYPRLILVWLILSSKIWPCCRCTLATWDMYHSGVLSNSNIKIMPLGHPDHGLSGKAHLGNLCWKESQVTNIRTYWKVIVTAKTLTKNEIYILWRISLPKYMNDKGSRLMWG